jgi:nucleotide-binding universal stress UspA family protein
MRPAPIGRFRTGTGVAVYRVPDQRDGRQEAVMKILIGMDDSPFSDAALEYVRGMRWPEGTKVIVLTAIRSPIAVYSEVYVPPTPQGEGVLQEQMREHQELVSRGERLLKDAGLQTEARVLRGDPREALVDAARNEGADLLVVGSHGRTGLAKLLMGSVAAHVVAHAPCSVLVVKPGDRAA